MVRYHFSARKLKSTLKPSKDVVWRQKRHFFVKMHLEKGVFSRGNSRRASLEGFPASFLAKSVDQLFYLLNLIKLIN